MSPPLVSIVIPTYNRSQSLLTTLEALSRQTYPRQQFEVLVVNDGSTDDTDQVLRQYVPKAPYSLHILRQTNAGPACARNLGVHHAAGELIVFIDDDVEPTSRLLEAHAVHRERSERLAVIGPMVRDPAIRWQEACWVSWEHDMLLRQYESWRDGIWPGVGPNHFYTGNASVRRAHVLLAGGFDPSITRREDVDLAYRLHRRCGVTFAYEPAAVGVHRPQRSLESWLAIPNAYAQFDILHTERGDDCEQAVHTRNRRRSILTRLLARTARVWPKGCAAGEGALLQGARVCHRPGLERLSLRALSVVYGQRYLRTLDECSTRGRCQGEAMRET